MENSLYNILWIDDEHESLLSFIGQAKKRGIILSPYKSLEGGLGELEKNYTLYDGILLDAKFFENEEDKANTEDTKHVHRAKDRIIRLPKKFEIFVLTGQAEAYDNRTFSNAFSNVYRKGIDSDINKLFEDLISASNNLEDTQLRHRFSDVIKVCTEKYLGDDSQIKLLKILRDIDQKKDAQLTAEGLNSVRKIIEKIFGQLNRLKIIPDEIFKNKGWINGSSLFLAGKHSDYIIKEGVIPPSITFLLYSILQVTQDGSHNEGDLKLRINDHIIDLGTSYLYSAVVYQLLDVLIWFKGFVDSEPEPGNWQKIETEEIYRGIIEQDSDGNYYCGEYLLNYLNVHNNLKLGEKIIVLQYNINTNYKSKQLYKYYANKFELTEKL